jgi:hypothetical protein
MTNKIKFTQVSRVICPKTGVHYLDAVDTEGLHWMAEMEHEKEQWLCYDRVWYKDPQQPYDTL